MKTLLLFTFAIIFMNYAHAQKVKESDVPKAVVAAFQAQFKGAKVKAWDKENGKYEVEFELNKTETSADFSPEGKLLETEVEIKPGELSKTIIEYIAKNFAGYKIMEAAKTTDADGKITFEAEVKNGKEKMDLIFDNKGNFIKKMSL